MTWALFRAGVHDAVALAGGLHTDAVVWGNAGQTIAPTLARLFLTAVAQPAPTRESRTEAPAGYSLSLSIMRECTVQVRVETIHCAVAGEAAEIAARIQLGLDLQDVRAVLEAAGLVVIEALDLSDFSFKRGDHMVSAHAFDLRVRWVETLADPTPIGVIEHAVVSGTADDIAIGPDTVPELAE